MSAFSAPPPQAMATPNIQVQDDDDILMDYEDDIPTTTATPPQTNSGDDAMMMDASDAPPVANAGEEEVIVPERIHIRGVDNLSTAQVKAYVAEHFPTTMVRLDWIDDTSLNAVYETPALAMAALAALSLPKSPEELPLLQLRPTKSFSQSPDSRLSARISKPSDRKEPGARERSRYYLFHPEEDRAEKFERERRERRSRPRNGRSREPERERGDYSRRYYDSREDGARRRNDEYTEDMYDDAPKLQRSRSRSRSRSPDRHNSRRYSRSPPSRRSRPELFHRRRSRSPRRDVELFPAKRSRSLSQHGPPKELFPERTRGSSAAMDNVRPAPTQPPPRELFPTRAPAATERELFPERVVVQDLFASRPSKELFPQRTHSSALSHTTTQQKPRSLAERIKIPPKSLAERISLPASSTPSSSSPSPIMQPGDDLFAHKMMSSKGEGLMSDNMIGGGRRRRGRKKADEFM